MKGRKIFPPLIAAAITVIMAWAMKQWGQLEVPSEVAVAFTTIFTMAISLLTPDAMEADE